MIKHILVIISSAVLLSGCATGNSYVEPTGQPVATIQDYNVDRGLTNWDMASIVSIDNKSVSPSVSQALLGSDAKGNIIAVTPGQHTFVVSTQFARSFFGGANEAYSEVRATLLANNHYRINENVQDSHVLIWITNLNGQVVSPVVSEPFHAVTSQTVYMPVVTGHK